MAWFTLGEKIAIGILLLLAIFVGILIKKVKVGSNETARVKTIEDILRKESVKREQQYYDNIVKTIIEKIEKLEKDLNFLYAEILKKQKK